jgi:hypothetical protein
MLLFFSFLFFVLFVFLCTIHTRDRAGNGTPVPRAPQGATEVYRVQFLREK